MDPSSERSRGWNFVICREVMLVCLWEEALYCWVILFFMGWRWLWCWEDDAGSDSWVVILSSTINKVIWVFLHIIVYLWMQLHGQCISDYALFMVLYFEMLWWCFVTLSLQVFSEARQIGEELQIPSREREIKQRVKRKIQAGPLCFSLIYHT